MENLKVNYDIFESIKHVDEEGHEFWYARELMKTLDYSKWEKFVNVIENAITACNKSGYTVDEHFSQVGKMINIAKGAKREIYDYKMSRYARYLVVQCADSRKEIVALGKTYFAIQTRKQELNELEYNKLSEDDKRFYQRNLTRKGNYSLNQAAKNAGVKNFDKFHNAGYKGLYNNANKTHYNMGRDIRNFIASQGGTMPENLPTPSRILKELEKNNKKVPL